MDVMNGYSLVFLTAYFAFTGKQPLDDFGFGSTTLEPCIVEREIS
jgi:hypothetical protein